MKKILLLSTFLLLGLSAYSENTPCNLTDEGVLINGIRWATRNVDAPGTFAETPESFGMLFQWNRKKGWCTRLPFSELEGWDSSLPEGAKWKRENDPCPTGWRLPTREELKLLYNVGSEWITKNGRGGRLFGVEPYQIFLPAAGFRHCMIITRCEITREFFNDFPGDFIGNNSYGAYWSSTRGGRLCAWFLEFKDCGVKWIPTFTRTNGLSIRCVAK